jgi:prophage antirepressor-like protein
MHELQIFNNPEFGQIRMVEIDGKPYAVANDVAKALGYAYPADAIRMHCKGSITYRYLTNGGEQEIKIIPEGDIYRLIVKAADQSKNEEIKAKAERFERWIFEEVLPTIRKTGGYVAHEDLFIETYLPYADEATKALFKSTLQTIREQNEKIRIMQPKAEYFDALVERNLLTNFRDTAKELGIKERIFINWLISKRFIYRDQRGDLRPYAPYNKVLFEIKEWTRNEKVGVQTLVTPKGRETFRLLLQKDNLIQHK